MRSAAALAWLILSFATRANALAPGDHLFALQSGGLERSYLVHLPPAKAIAPAVILNFHGGGGNPVSHQKYVRMDVLADREGFIVVYPAGTGRFREKLLTWNAGSRCGSAARDNVDDVGFTAALLEDLGARIDYDRQRVYATGFSNGAMMVYRLAVELPDRIAAIAPVAGASVVRNFAPQRPMAIMHIHSIDDPRALYRGGLGPPFPPTSARVLHTPVGSTISRWADFDGCGNTPEEREKREWRSGESVHTATRLVFSNCRDRVEVVLWRLTGAGHVWPGGTPAYLTRWLGPSTLVIDANEEVWRFFRRFALRRATSGALTLRSLKCGGVAAGLTARPPPLPKRIVNLPPRAAVECDSSGT
jgi:polyhydroxybutyrate depolymerase